MKNLTIGFQKNSHSVYTMKVFCIIIYIRTNDNDFQVTTYMEHLQRGFYTW